MSSIVTFYSYKGGVGRSMALANIALELARRNKKVMMIDWDLEAPGLERYFSAFKYDTAAPGLLPLLLALQQGRQPEYKDYLWTIDTHTSHPLYLLHSGREKDPAAYSSALGSFNWEVFFEQNAGGLHLEALRNQWLQDFDFVLIDSRTGLSDASGICTIFLPDVIVPMFTANFQSLFGISDIVRYIQAARQKLSVDRMALTILPVPSRFGTKVEFRESQDWLDRIADILKECFSDWLPKWIDPRYVLEQIKIPQVDYFSFGEKLAVAEQGTNDPESMGYIYSRLADLLASDFSDIENFLGKTYYQQKKAEYESRKQPEKSLNASAYIYDLYISAPRAAYQWVKELLLPALTEYLSDELGHSPAIAFDLNETNLSQSFSVLPRENIEKSRLLLQVYGAADAGNEFLRQDLIAFEARQRQQKARIIFPVLYSGPEQEGGGLPVYSGDHPVTDLSVFNSKEIYHSTKVRTRFGMEVQLLATRMADSIRVINQGGQVTSDAEKEAAALLEIEALALEYEELRRRMPGSNRRTDMMEHVVSKMKAKATIIIPLLPQLSSSKSPGKRLAAIAALQERPDVQYLPWLSEHLGAAERPFVGYHATVALYIAARTMGTEHKQAVVKALDTAAGKLKEAKNPDPNQVSVLDAARTELSYK